jgi:hypothetical protein
MRVRRFELRLVALVLTVGWSVAAAIVFIGYRPGGPIDLLVGIAAFPAAAIAALGLVWPPVARGDRPFWAIAWIGILAVLVLLPSIGGLVEQLRARGPQTLLPSPTSAYPWLVALGATGVFAGLGIARRVLGETALRRRRLVVGIAVGATLTLVAASGFATVAIANDLALRDRAATASRFGPTDPTLDLPPCDGPLAAGASARITFTMQARSDLRRVGDLVATGGRLGVDAKWTGQVASSVALGRYGAARIGTDAWALAPRTGWRSVPPSSLAGVTLDLHVLETALTPGIRATAEDDGIGMIEGARARRCRVAVDGPTFVAAFPQVALLVGQADLSRWRGQLDYWVFGDGELGRVAGSASGEGADLVPKGVLGAVDVVMTATDRGTIARITPPIGEGS